MTHLYHCQSRLWILNVPLHIFALNTDFAEFVSLMIDNICANKSCYINTEFEKCYVYFLLVLKGVSSLNISLKRTSVHLTNGGLLTEVHGASKETYHFFRATLTKIHAININIWTQIIFNTPQ